MTTALERADAIIKKPKAKPRAAKPPARKAKGRALAVHKPQPPASLYELAVRMTMAPNVDPAKLDAILATLERQEQLIAKRAYDLAMLKAQSMMPPVKRDSWNDHTKSWWARLESVNREINPIIHECGFTVEVKMGHPRIDGHYHVIATCTWNGVVDGKPTSHSVEYPFDIGRDDIGAKGGGTKTGAQGSGSVLTYARRYAKLAIFDVTVAGMDNDAQGPNVPVSQQQAEQIKARIVEGGIDIKRVLTGFKVSRVEDIPAAKFAQCMRGLDQIIGQEQAAESK